MEKLTTYERMKLMYNHQEADRVPITDWIWESTLWNWRKQGLPYVVDWKSYCGLDKIVRIGQEHIDTSPQFHSHVIEENEIYIIQKDVWGMTAKNFKPISSTPTLLDCEIKDPDTWKAAKQRMIPSRDRIDWSIWKTHYKMWRNNGYWIEVAPWFGFDIINSRMIGTETTLIAMIECPEWIRDVLNHGCDLAIALLDMIWAEGYTFDEVLWFDDLGYKNTTLISIDMWKELIRPYQKRFIEWAHLHGIKTHLHSCGHVKYLIPHFLEIGLDMLEPMEVKAGMDPIDIKRKYGKELVLKGGMDVRNWVDIDKAKTEIQEKLPILKESGGYVFCSDHSIADNVSLQNYMKIVETAKAVGSY